MAEPADPRRTQKYGGNTAPDQDWYSRILAEDNWAQKKLIKGFQITIPEFELADDDLVKLLAKNDTYNLKYGVRSTEERLNPVLDKIEQLHPWLTNSAVPRSWRHRALKGWVRDKMRWIRDQVKKNPDFLEDDYSKTQRRHARFDDPRLRPRTRPDKPTATFRPLLQCSLRITFEESDSLYTVIRLVDLIPEGVSKFDADGNLNINSINWAKFLAALQDGFAEAFEDVGEEEAFVYSKKAYIIGYQDENEGGFMEVIGKNQLKGAIQEMRVPGSAMIRLELQKRPETESDLEEDEA